MLFRINERIYGVRNLLIDAFKAISILAACIVIAAFVVAIVSTFALATYNLMGLPGIILLTLAACGFVFIGTNQLRFLNLMSIKLPSELFVEWLAEGRAQYEQPGLIAGFVAEKAAEWAADQQLEESFCENLQELRGRFERVVFAARDRSAGHIELADRLIDAVVAQFGSIPEDAPPNQEVIDAKRLHDENVEAEQQDPKSRADKMSPSREPDHWVVWQGIAYWIHPTGRALMAVPITSAFIDFSKSKHVQDEEERNSTSLRKIANFLNLFN